MQERMGRNFRPFRIIKFRTMAAGSEREGPFITVCGDNRITRLGRFLRKYKIDELPQLINVLKGDMSLVGPRPEVKKYVGLFRSDYEKLLTVRPGITDPASLQYSDEEGLLSLAGNWEEDYLRRILPAKIRLSSEYVDNHGVVTDIKLILKTILRASGADPASRLRAES
jgi:lipopolysaccharide/colanic/teichoic acid biosynthesis glycosyltransferase